MADQTNIADPLIPPSPRMQFTGTDRLLTGPGMRVLQSYYKKLNGLVPTLTCNVSGTNTLTITPVNISPFIQDYHSFLGMAFVATDTSTGAVQALLSIPTGDLATLPVYNADCTTQLGAGDIIAGNFYIFNYVDTVNSGNGGFVVSAGIAASTIITCTATGTNAYTLTPTNNSIAAYRSLQIFSFVAPNTSTSTVTAKVGSLAFKGVFTNTGATVGAGSVTQDQAYLLVYSLSRDGFTLK